MKKYQIKIKRDFGRYGWWCSQTRTTRRDGFVVCDGICNVMPGAVWFKTIEQAFEGISVLEESLSTGRNFWDIYKERRQRR